MKILVDMNLSPDWVGALKASGLDAIHWSQVGDPTAPDEDILAWAKHHQHLVFTHDLDFGRLLALTHAVGPSVLQVRAEDVVPAALADTVLQVLDEHDEAFRAGALAVIELRAQRVRLLPL